MGVLRPSQHRLALKNLIRQPTSRFGRDTWLLQTLSGEPVEAFTSFCEHNSDYPLATRKRYAEVVGRFLDYLFEVGVFSAEGVTARRLNDAIDAYPQFLRDGSEGLIKRIESRGPTTADEWLIQVARSLSWTRLRPNSLSNTLAAVNRFLSLSENLARQELERARLLGLEHVDSPTRLIKALDGNVTIPVREVTRMRQNSLLGSVAKFNSKGIRRPKRLALAGTKQQDDRRERDFPITHLQDVVSAARCWRDRALWLLLAASGIRSSEARNLLLQDIDFERQQVYVVDPSNRRFRLPASMQDEPRFKGRSIAVTYLFPPLRQQFFLALKRYLEEEFVPAYQPGQPQFLFQYVEPRRRGQPLVNASDTAINKPFRAAVDRANVPLPGDDEHWTLHSLRHLYGVYMLNDYPLAPGRFGLPLTDIQMLMGHKSIRTTEKYARPKATRLMAKLQASDESLLGLDPGERLLLPSGVLEQLEEAA